MSMLYCSCKFRLVRLAGRGRDDSIVGFTFEAVDVKPKVCMFFLPPDDMLDGFAGATGGFSWRILWR